MTENKKTKVENQVTSNNFPNIITKTIYPLMSKKGRVSQLQELANESIKIQSQIASLNLNDDLKTRPSHLSNFRLQLSAIEQTAAAIRAIQGEDRLFQSMVRIFVSIFGGIFGFILGKNWEKIMSLFS
jgi:hypothetical protein